MEFPDFIYPVRWTLNFGIPLNVHLIRGSDYAVYIDSGINALFDQLLSALEQAQVPHDRLRFILHTHSHHDHIGCDRRLKERTGCLIAVHPLYAAWHTDFERHYQEFARSFPELIPDTPELRAEVLGILDGEHKVDLLIDEGITFDLGGVQLVALAFPGHMKAELGWLEPGSRTLILGDAITGLDWPIFHSHLSVRSYRTTLQKIRGLVADGQVERVLFAHFPPMVASDVVSLIEQAERYLEAIEITLIRILAEHETATLGELWRELCARMGRHQEFRALNTVHAHIEDLMEREVIREVEHWVYALR